MSQLLINDYLKQLDIIKKASGSQRETIVREAFKDLLKAWGRQQGLIFLAEYPLKTPPKPILPSMARCCTHAKWGHTRNGVRSFNITEMGSGLNAVRL